MGDDVGRFHWACLIGCLFILNDTANALAEDVFITKTGKHYYSAGSPFVKTRATIRINKQEAESKGYKPSKSYLKAKTRENINEKGRFFEETSQ
jgi:hypothetical protein